MAKTKRIGGDVSYQVGGQPVSYVGTAGQPVSLLKPADVGRAPGGFAPFPSAPPATMFAQPIARAPTPPPVEAPPSKFMTGAEMRKQFLEPIKGEVDIRTQEQLAKDIREFESEAKEFQSEQKEYTTHATLQQRAWELVGKDIKAWEAKWGGRALTMGDYSQAMREREKLTQRMEELKKVDVHLEKKGAELEKEYGQLHYEEMKFEEHPLIQAEEKVGRVEITTPEAVSPGKMVEPELFATKEQIKRLEFAEKEKFAELPTRPMGIAAPPTEKEFQKIMGYYEVKEEQRALKEKEAFLEERPEYYAREFFVGEPWGVAFGLPLLGGISGVLGAKAEREFYRATSDLPTARLVGAGVSLTAFVGGAYAIPKVARFAVSQVKPRPFTIIEPSGKKPSLYGLQMDTLGLKIQQELKAPSRMAGMERFIEEFKLRKYPRFGVEKRVKGIDIARQQLLEREALETVWEKGQLKTREIFELERKYPQFKVEKPPKDWAREQLLERERLITGWEKGQLKLTDTFKLERKFPRPKIEKPPKDIPRETLMERERIEKAFYESQKGLRKKFALEELGGKKGIKLDGYVKYPYGFPEPKPIDLTKFLRPEKKLKPFKYPKPKPEPKPVYREVPTDRAVQVQVTKTKAITQRQLAKTVSKQEAMQLSKTRASLKMSDKAMQAFVVGVLSKVIPKAAPVFLPKAISKAKEAIIPKIKPSEIPAVKPLYKPIQEPKMAPMQIAKVKEIAITETKPIVEPKFKPIQEAKFKPYELTKLKEITKPKKGRFLWIPFPELSFIYGTPTKRVPGHITKVKSEGKWKRVPGVRTKLAALSLGAQMVDNSAARSFDTDPANRTILPKRIPEFAGWNNLSWKFRKPKHGRYYVEKTAHAIDSFGEIMGISAKGWAALRGMRLRGIPIRKRKRRKRKR